MDHVTVRASTTFSLACSATQGEHSVQTSATGSGAQRETRLKVLVQGADGTTSECGLTIKGYAEALELGHLLTEVGAYLKGGE